MRRATGILAAGMVAALVWVVYRGTRSAPVAPATRPASRPAFVAAAQGMKPEPVATYSQWLQRQSGFEGVERQTRLLPLFDAAHLICPEGAVVDSRGGIWVIDPQGPAFAQAASAKIGERDRVTRDRVSRDRVTRDRVTLDRVTRDRVVAVFWCLVAGQRQAYGVVEEEGGRWAMLGGDGSRRLLGRRGYDWPRLRVRDEYCIVPGEGFVSALRPGEKVLEEVFEFPQKGDEPVQLVEAAEVLAFVPQHRADAAPIPVMSYGQGRWQAAGAGWQGPVLHLRPLADPNFVQFIRPGESAGTVQMEIVPRVARRVQRERVVALIGQLSSDKPLERDRAERLLDMPDNWPVIEELLGQQPPEARLRMQEILSRRSTCSLGRWEIRGGRLELVQRLRRGAIFHAAAGLTGEGAVSRLAVMDGEVAVLSAPAEVGLKAGRLYRVEDDWLVWQEGRYQLAATQQRLTRKSEGRFTQLVGEGASGWVLGVPGERECLIIDRQTADPTPRLPGWEIVVEGETGWDSSNWPAMRKGGGWSLREAGWKAMRINEETFISEVAAVPASSTGSATLTGLSPATGMASAVGATTRMSGITEPGGMPVELPEEARGSLSRWHFAFSPGGELYLYNEPGRVVRLVRQAGLWRVMAVHSQNLPRVESPRRFWVDPAGRLCMAWENRLGVYYPKGRIPAEILELMPREQLMQLERDE